ncbi:MAG: thermonuclease family protein [Sneathiella sp.]
MKIYIFAFCSFFLLPSISLADQKSNLYAAEVTSVYDGDTVTMDVLIWVGQTVEAKVRLKGIDTPEIRGKCAAEKELAIKARDFLRDLTKGSLTVLEAIPFTGKATGKYGRVIGTLYTPLNENINLMMIEKGYGRAYDGGKRESWC